MKSENLSEIVLPSGIRSRYVNNHNGLLVHVLEAGFEDDNRPVLMLLHGFPELAYSWRKIMVPLAAAGYHVIAPDQRGYGRTTGWKGSYDQNPAAFRTHNMARDVLGLSMAMGIREVDGVIGHDFGAVIASYCTLVRPDFFRKLVLLSVPFAGAPDLPFDTVDESPGGWNLSSKIYLDLASLPRPRKDNQVYFGSRWANDDMMNCPQGLHDFLRAYFHVKSADWKENKPQPLAAFSAEELAKVPAYYYMDMEATMPETVAPYMPSTDQIASCKWLTDSELKFYSEEFERTSFQGAVQWFRCYTGEIGRTELELFSGKAIDVPSCYIAGESDWGMFRRPGAVEKMRAGACSRLERFEIIKNAGHWVQQEAPERVSEIAIEFLNAASPKT
ncbi:alpha/beta hydrolase [Paraburkholderia oxyphila]|uniref:alpha/beta hydrolase n=1 Tax=Paraburkholderia oxyphila TaxID=614212 RepID=UPI0005B816C7|nr:alpha/beta hydrolase [Paraburkholderia oxyphila]